MFKNKILFFLLVFKLFCLNIFAQYNEQDQYGQKVSVDSKQLIQNIDDLTTLENLKDIAVIQRKFLKKTKRFELFGAANIALNSQYFNLLGVNFSGTYHFSERWGIEIQGMFLSSLEKSLTEGLRRDQAILTQNIITPESYYGLNLRWSPIYGKMSLREKTINPFEVYFALGLGMTGTDDSQSVLTVHGEIGQVYPLLKDITFRWGLGLNNFFANAKSDLKGSVQGEKVNANLFYLSAGMSMYFPFSKERQ